MTSVLVIGGTGAVGAPTVRALRDLGAAVRLLVRTPRPAPSGIEVVVGRADDRDTVTAALDGCHAALLVTPHVQPDEESALASSVLDACAARGARLTCFSAGIPGESAWSRAFWGTMIGWMMPHYRERIVVINRVFAHAAAPRLTAAGFFCQNTEPFLDDIFAGRFTEPTGRHRLPRVHADDIGLLNARHARAAVESVSKGELAPGFPASEAGFPCLGGRRRPLSPAETSLRPCESVRDSPVRSLRGPRRGVGPRGGSDVGRGARTARGVPRA